MSLTGEEKHSSVAHTQNAYSTSLEVWVCDERSGQGRGGMEERKTKTGAGGWDRLQERASGEKGEAANDVREDIGRPRRRHSKQAERSGKFARVEGRLQ
eukprot:677299-Pleurochrysis_carterae.AAC.2